MEAAKSTPIDLTEESDKDVAECPVCLQPYVYPAQLPCGHIFCFLCIKGTANQSKRCAMCRQEIPRDFIERPNLLKNKHVEESDGSEGSYQWFYEGRNGWWQYDERTSKELEVAYNSGERTCELLIAGFLYVMDFDAMLQLRRADPSRRRRMKRDLLTIDKKGIAGLRIEHSEENAAGQPTSQHARTRPYPSVSRGGEDGASGPQTVPAAINPSPTSRPYNLRSRPSYSRLGDGSHPVRCSPIPVDRSSDSEEDAEDDNDTIEGEPTDPVTLTLGSTLQNVNINDD